ncbi:LacI family DNA-binding transcriptional regulator [Pediococcus siamensis]|uniref:LacI family DNA-binding transcriptional regulator n=1 Tax=Pediococcus siamensis TaxID=381829 RepID=UPI0039A2EDA3
MTIKMNDIAKIAHVSKSAVSLAINSKPGISEETRQKILDVIAHEGYKPLRKRRKSEPSAKPQIKFLVITSSGVVKQEYNSLPFFSSLIYSLTTRIREMDGNLETITIQIDDLARQIKELHSDKSSSFLVLGTDLSAKQVELLTKSLERVVFIDTYFSAIDANFVTMDNYQGARIAAQYILSKGYKDIGYLASDHAMANFSERRRGFREALMEKNIKISNNHFYFISPTDIEPHGLNMASIVHDKSPRAIFCEDDYIALRLIKSAILAGLRVPQDLAIMGFDDIFEGTLISPELTTIHVQIDQIVNQALLQIKFQQTQQNWQPQKTLIATKLIARQSL